MAFSLTSDMNLLKNMPAYKPLLKTVLKSQIQLLVEQLSEYGDEECMFLTASLTDGTLSYIGSKYGHSFLTKYKNIKGNFLKFCLEKNNDSNHVQHLTTVQSPGPPKEQRKLNKRQHIIKQPEPKRFKLESHDTDVSANELIADITVDTSPKQSKDNIDTSTSRQSEQSEKNKEKMKHQQETKIVKYSHEINGYEIGLKGSKENDEIQNCDNFDDTNNMNSFIVKVEPDWEANCEDVTINMEDKFNTESSARGTTNTENRYNRESSVSSENSLSCTDISSSYQNSRSGLKEAFLRPEFLCCNDRLIWEKNKLPKQKRVIKSVPLWKKYSAIKEVELKKENKSYDCSRV
ncbi:uncharacterized protein LOC132718034 [Ruditapes philippinarum]|uniref:uncharacterized protein LOC132718034 n=1 Tax=Ruditapes philippinarum TaxID=129788 RepID=UPI00295B32EB|nr:uncharacterized protein LOC132718034 [Ruditapes philippinarum]